MAGAKTMVFLPSDIFTSRYPGDGSQPKVRLFGDDRPMWSTGKLEKAIEQGYACCVLLPEAAVFERDGWWLAILDKAKGKKVDLGNGMDLFSSIALDAMREFYEEHGLPWNDSWQCWHSALHTLGFNDGTTPPSANVALARNSNL